MIPTLAGRIQTRIFVLALVGSLTTLLISLVLPGRPGSLGDTYRTTFAVLIAVTVLGVLWEFVYHGLMQFRWEKDWPMLFGLVTALNEGALVWILIKADLIPGVDSGLGLSTFLVDFAVVWLVTFLFVNGPMRVPFIRWRHNGGRLV
ncbi:MAG TPA: hypothetical protein VLR26_02715 [Frankiaceae bacterium]|nr:hypothetical protein [Frankiaceae bacterium]